MTGRLRTELTMALALAFVVGGGATFDTPRGRWAALAGLTFGLIAGVERGLRERLTRRRSRSFRPPSSGSFGGDEALQPQRRGDTVRPD